MINKATLTPTMERLIGNEGVRQIFAAHHADLWRFDATYSNKLVIWDGAGHDSIGARINGEHYANLAFLIDEDADDEGPLKSVTLFVWGAGRFKGHDVKVTAWFHRPTFWLEEADYEREVTIIGNPTIARKILNTIIMAKPEEVVPVSSYA